MPYIKRVILFCKRASGWGKCHDEGGKDYEKG